MIFETYREVLEHAGRAVAPLRLRIHNEIPLSMGCGSSAAALLASVLLANHFGALGWHLSACIDEALLRLRIHNDLRHGRWPAAAHCSPA